MHSGRPDGAARQTGGARAHGSACPPLWLLGSLALGAMAVYALAIGNAARRIGEGMGDFHHFYFAARAMLEGSDPYTSWRHGYIYPPLLAFLEMPMGALSQDAAAVVLLVCNVAALGAGTWIAARGCAARAGVLSPNAVALATASIATIVLADKVKSELQMWQTNGLLLLALALGLRWLDSRRAAAGSALAFAFNIKFLPILWLPYLVVRRRWIVVCAFVIGAGVFGVLPALRTGPSENGRQLAVAYAGVLELAGVHTGTGVRPRNPLEAEFSTSISSAIARLMPGAEPWEALLAAGGLAASLALTAGAMYRSAGVPFLRWPDASGQRTGPYAMLIAAEWSGLITGALGFSPQTNTRHLVLLVMPAAFGATLLWTSSRRSTRRIVAIWLILLAAGTSLPPGGKRYGESIHWWRGIAGPCWTAVAFYFVTLWGALRELPASERPVKSPAAPAS